MFTQRDAVAIAQKLGAEIVHGREHDLVIFRYGGSVDWSIWYPTGI